MSAVDELEVPVDEQPEPGTGDEDEPDEGEDTPEPTPEDEPEAARSPQSEKEIEKANKALEAEKKRHADRIGVIMGEDSLSLVECEACAANIPGFHWPAADFPEGTPERAIYELLSGGTDVLPVQPDFLHTCKACNGLGQWRTGSHGPAVNQTLTCSVCGGIGYTDDRKTQPAAVPLVAVPDAPAPAPAEPATETDMIGRPFGHPNYGMMPVYMTPEQIAADEYAAKVMA